MWTVTLHMAKEESGYTMGLREAVELRFLCEQDCGLSIHQGLEGGH
jgi:hypothetical protein